MCHKIVFLHVIYVIRYTDVKVINLSMLKRKEEVIHFSKVPGFYQLQLILAQL